MVIRTVICVGYLLVADFGLAKFVSESEMANSFCGTAEYLAPEMLIGNGHDYTVDWWALGILIYEMIVGIPPFFHKNKNKMYHFIKESKVNFPDPERHKIFVSDNAKDLILRLLDKNKKTRLGVNGIDEIMKHPWFADLDLDALIAKKLEPPYKPDSNDDLAYFDQKLVNQTEMAESVVPAQQRQIINAGQHSFKGFSS
jgi:serum/glucocorticoid-regulated kinase 2